MTFEAIEHAVEADDAGLVADLLTPVILVYLGAGQVNTVRAWLDRLGEESVAADPRLCLVAGTGQMVLGDDPEISRWLDRAEQLPYTGPLPGGPASIEAGVATVRGIVTSGRLSQHLEAARRAVELERDDSTIWRQLAFGASERRCTGPATARGSALLRGGSSLAGTPADLRGVRIPRHDGGRRPRRGGCRSLLGRR